MESSMGSTRAHTLDEGMGKSTTAHCKTTMQVTYLALPCLA